MVAARAHFPPNLKVSLGLDTEANAWFSERCLHSMVPANWQTGAGGGGAAGVSSLC